MRHLCDMYRLRNLRLRFRVFVRKHLSTRDRGALSRKAVSELHKHLQAPNLSLVKGDFFFGNFDKICAHVREPRRSEHESQFSLSAFGVQ